MRSHDPVVGMHFYDTGERRPAVLIAVQPQADKLTSIRP
jgi:hypothetical protein